MSDKPKAGPVKPFTIGLIIGLVLGGLGGAYLGGLAEGPRLKPAAGKPAPAANPNTPRDARPTDVAPPAPTGDAPTNQALPEPHAAPK